MGKGSLRRPRQVSREEEEANWFRTFGTGGAYVEHPPIWGSQVPAKVQSNPTLEELEAAMAATTRDLRRATEGRPR